MNDRKLHRIAEKRVSFRRHLLIYFFVNALLFGIYAYINYKIDTNYRSWPFPWPVYPTIFWGIGVGIDFIKTYSMKPGEDPHEKAVEKEVERLKQERLK